MISPLVRMYLSVMTQFGNRYSLRTMAHSLFSSGVLSITQSIIRGSQLPFPSTVSRWHIWIQHHPTLTQDRELTFVQPHPLHHSPVGLHAQAATYTGQTISSTPCSALGGGGGGGGVEWCSRLIRTLYSTRGHIQNIRCT